MAEESHPEGEVLQAEEMDELEGQEDGAGASRELIEIVPRHPWPLRDVSKVY
jgi:hypothetical protein